MPLGHVVIFAALQGLAEALPISRSGHGALARIWLDAGPSSPGSASLEAALSLGAALALIAATRRRLLAALRDGLRALGRPSLVRTSPGAHDAAVLAIGCGVSLAVSLFLQPRVARPGEPPFAAGIGLLVTGAALASTVLARRVPEAGGPGRSLAASRESPSLPGAAIVGLVHGLAVFPGASRLGAALVLLLWMGVRAPRAVDLAFLLTLPSLIASFVQGVRRGVDLDAGTLMTGLLFAFLAALLASGLLRRLVERRRLAALALWIIPLGLAMIAYARALPPPGA